MALISFCFVFWLLIMCQFVHCFCVCLYRHLYQYVIVLLHVRERVLEHGKYSCFIGDGMIFLIFEYFNSI